MRKRATAQGFRVEKRDEFWFFWPADRELPAVRIGGTPHHSGRAWDNFMAAMKRSGDRVY
ncbi:MAG TPA: hypothetical protein VIA06_00510 [Candidatus Dormibacteraeota bacterium]|nr:hypothetical protein [Candidatus Dormibacteraeota bacterium]